MFGLQFFCFNNSWNSKIKYHTIELIDSLHYDLLAKVTKCLLQSLQYPKFRYTPNSLSLERAWSRGIVDRTTEYSFVLS